MRLRLMLVTLVLLATGCGPGPLLIGLGAAIVAGAGGHGGGGGGGNSSPTGTTPSPPSPPPPPAPPPSPPPSPSPGATPTGTPTLAFTTQPAATTAGVSMPTAGLIRHWALDEGSGTVAHDTSGNGADGTIAGGTWATSVVGAGLRFAPSGPAQVSCGSVPALALTDDFTWSFLFLQRKYTSSFETILGNWDSNVASPNRHFVRFMNVGFEYFVNGNLEAIIGYTPPQGQWVRLTVVKSGANLSYYADNAVVGTATVQHPMGSCPFFIGSDPSIVANGTPSEFTSGDVADVRLYERALSAFEIGTLVERSKVPEKKLSPIVVAVRDLTGALVTQPTAVTLDLSKGVRLSGTTTVTSVNGSATFSDLAVDAPGSYTFTARASGFTSATSASFDVGLPPGPLTFAIASRSDHAVYELSTITGGYAIEVGDLGSVDPVGLAAASGDTLYVLDELGQRIVALSRSTGQTTNEPQLDFAPSAQIGFTRSFKGEYLYLGLNGGLRFVTPTTGLTFGLPSSSVPSVVTGIAVDPWNTIYIAGASSGTTGTTLYSFDALRNVATTIGSFGVSIDALTWGSDGFLYGLSSGSVSPANLYRIDPRTGAATVVTGTNIMNASALVEVPGYLARSANPAPWVRRTVPDVLVAGTTTDVVLVGEGLDAATTLQSESVGVSIVSERTSAAGDQRVVTLSVASGPYSVPISLRATSAAGSSRFVLPVLDDTAPLTIGATDTVHLAGAIHVPSLTIAAGGVLRGVGLKPLFVFSEGDVQIDGTLDASGWVGGIAMGTGSISPPYVYRCADGGDGGPGGGGGGGGGAAERAAVTQGGDGGWGFSGGGGGGGSPGGYLSGRGGLGAGSFGGAATTNASDFSNGGDGGETANGAHGGFGGPSGGGGGTGSDTGAGGPAGQKSGQSAATGQGGGGGAQQSSNGTGGGAGSFGTSGENGRLSQSTFTGGGPAGQVYGTASLVPLVGGSGGGGGSGRGAFNGLSGGGGGGGGALVVASRGTITVSATGAILAEGGQASRWPSSDGEGGSGSGGAVLVQASTVQLASGGKISAVGAPRPDGAAANGYAGAGGDGRIRVDATTLVFNGSTTTSGAFATDTTPTTGFFGSATPSTSITTPGASSGVVTISYSASDAESSYVFLDVEYSVNGGGFVAATSAAASERTFAVATSPGGTAHTFQWDSAKDLGTGMKSVVVRVRAVAASAGSYAATGAFNVTN